MKRYALMVMVMFVLMGCSKSPIDIVKGGVLNYDKSTTVQKALEGHKFFKKPKWKLREDKQGRKYVNFSAFHTQECGNKGLSSVSFLVDEKAGTFKAVNAAISTKCDGQKPKTIEITYMLNDFVDAIYTNSDFYSACPGWGADYCSE